jgi:hypothetical protein
MPQRPFALYAPIVLKLLQDVVDNTDTNWGLLLSQQVAIRDYVAQIGLSLYLNETDGYAYLYQPEHTDEMDRPVALPRLTRRNRLSYEVTLLLVLLRERLDRFDIDNPEADQLVVTHDEMREMVQPFLPERTNEQAIMRRIDIAINHIIEKLGFLKERKQGGYIVQRVIKSRIDSESLNEIKEKLFAHATEELKY